MHRRLCVILLLIATALPLRAAIPRWDALPAIDVLHLQGPHTGTQVCPMCRHGYDAGLLVFLPTTTPATDAGRIAQQLQATSAAIGDQRFRPFLILTGEPPSESLLAAVASRETNWYVAHLAADTLVKASRDFRTPLEGRTLGHVFAQRRLLWKFEPLAADASWTDEVTQQAHYAMTFLHANYAEPAASQHPDTPKGALWMAPAVLSSRVALDDGATPAAAQVCFSDAGTAPRPDALVAMSQPAARHWWAKSDASGCVSLQGTPPARENMRVVLFSALQPPAVASVAVQNLHTGTPLVVTVHNPAPPAVTGTEPVVVPCEGCEAVFQDLPGQLESVARLAADTEPGERLQLSGTVRDESGQPQPGIVVYAYQTDAAGEYPQDRRLSGTAALHGRLRGWASTDTRGQYRFDTVRPGAYPGGSEPQHVHLHVIEPGRCTYYLGDVLFDDDPLLTPGRRSQQADAFGGSGIVRAQGRAETGWRATRDIELGANVPGHGRCMEPRAAIAPNP